MSLDSHPLDTRVSLDREIVRTHLPVDLTFAGLAQHVGLPPESLSRAFTGERPITLATANIIAHRLGVPVGDIVQTCYACQQPLPSTLAMRS